jgi:hypothetical protein
MLTRKVEFAGSQGAALAARLELPEGRPRGYDPASGSPGLAGQGSRDRNAESPGHRRGERVPDLPVGGGLAAAELP